MIDEHGWKYKIEVKYTYNNQTEFKSFSRFERLEEFIFWYERKLKFGMKEPDEQDLITQMIISWDSKLFIYIYCNKSVKRYIGLDDEVKLMLLDHPVATFNKKEDVILFLRNLIKE